MRSIEMIRINLLDQDTKDFHETYRTQILIANYCRKHNCQLAKPVKKEDGTLHVVCGGVSMNDGEMHLPTLQRICDAIIGYQSFTRDELEPAELIPSERAICNLKYRKTG